ncbi:type ISP restriction/modification enzyme [Deinococcus taklimakanensis]|uniref:site-specific DNA-methyltransferase (adenine-specific) n=1 Tax=Deinococcus taklimakanensis TaxID=536443 RepID=A0ABW5P6G6_9DEIO
MASKAQTSAAYAAAVRTYLDRLEKDLKMGKATEHTHRAALSQLFNALMPDTDATNEPKRGKYGAPDYLITKKVDKVSLTLGHAEAKDVGANLDEVEKSEQMGRYRAALANLLLTDYLEFRWYKGGENQQQKSVLATWDAKNKNLERGASGAEDLYNLLTLFAGQQPQAIAKAKDLAERMAHLTHLIRDIVFGVLNSNEASETLTGLLESFKQTLLPSLTLEDFADMYAQTLAYGLFAARVNHANTGKTTSFTRQDAARNIPKTNPLLQKLFYTLTGPELDDEPYVGVVDELAQTLNAAKMDAILSEFGTSVREQDPIVHFYETFLAQYNPKLREQRGVYYTPTPVVDYIVRSVDALLKRDFEMPDGLADTKKEKFQSRDAKGRRMEVTKPRLLVADPATGTATFPYQIIRLLRERFNDSGNAGQWSHYVRDHLLHVLYGFELMMAPYAVAHLKLSMELGGLDLPDDTEAEQEEKETLSVELEHRLNIYLTNTLDDPNQEVVHFSGPFKAISDEAELAGRIKADYPVMVVLGNPPYSGHGMNKGQWMNDILKGVVRDTDGKIQKGNNFPQSLSSYYEVDDKPLGERNPKWLQDDYVKFIRWAQWRVHETGAGIVAFITPHGYLDNPTFRGMRQSLSRTFDHIYVLDLHGNANKKETAPDGSADQNVFDIRTGVAIGIFVRKKGAEGVRDGKVYRADLWGLRANKYDWLMQQDVLSARYEELSPQSPMYLWADQDELIRSEYEKGWKLTDIAPLNVMGFQTHRDDFAIAFDRADIEKRISDLRGNEEDAVLLSRYGMTESKTWKISKARKAAKSETGWKNAIQQVAYRPFDVRWSIYEGEVIDRPRRELLDNVVGRENLSLGVGRQGSAIAEDVWQLVTIAESPMDANMYRRGGVNIFPLYLYPPPTKHEEAVQPMFLGGDAGDVGDAFPIDAKGRTPNLSKGFISALSEATGLTFSPDGSGADAQHYSPEDVFHYVYAVLHSPSYRTRYADFLRTDFPRIPLPTSTEQFRALAALGEKLAGLHLLKTAPKVGGFPKAGTGEVEKGYPKYAAPTGSETEGKVLINAKQWFTEVCPEVWAYRVGGYQVAEKWLKERRGRVLNFADIQHYQQVLGALGKTIEIQKKIDEVGGFGGSGDLLVGLSNFSKDQPELYRKLQKIFAENFIDDCDKLMALSFEIYERIATITGDREYASRWFGILNPSLDYRFPIDLIKEGNFSRLSEILDDLEMELDSSGVEDA